MNRVHTPFSQATPWRPQGSSLQRVVPEHALPARGQGTGGAEHIQVTGIGGGAAPPQ